MYTISLQAPNVGDMLITILISLFGHCPRLRWRRLIEKVLKKWILQYPWEGLLIPPLTWAFERSLSAGCVYGGASDYYDAADYIRDRNDFDAITIQSA